IQTGFGPFISVYLTAQGWTQTSIGLALSLGTVTAMASQVPAGALVDAAPSKPAVVLCSVVAFSASALFFALWPVPLSIYAAEVIHGFSSCTLGPAINAISLSVAGSVLLGLRLGRNARFASIGNGIGAALMGACGYYVSERAVFFLTAALTLPAVASLHLLRGADGLAAARGESASRRERLSELISDRRLLIFAACAMLFTLANAALLPLAGSALTKRAGDAATLLIAACIVMPQLIVAAVSPTVGRVAQSRGRRWVLLLGFGAVPLRAALLALIPSPLPLVAIQALDGIAASCFGVMVPLVISDIAGGSGRYNLALGVIGLAIGVGATASTSLAGWISDQFGMSVAFAVLATVGLAAELLVWLAMPETQPE
ncbi:MAG: MFS transporter, partial [Stellaceae bacterium]